VLLGPKQGATTRGVDPGGSIFAKEAMHQSYGELTALLRW